MCTVSIQPLEFLYTFPCTVNISSLNLFYISSTISAYMMLPGLRPSIPNATYTVSFGVNDNPQSQTFLFEPIDDLVPREPVEPIQLVFTSISDSRVQEGPPADVNILDNDELG